MTKFRSIVLLFVLALCAGPAAAAPAKPAAKTETGSAAPQDLARFPDTDPKNVTDRLEQIQQEVYVSQQKDVMLQFLLQEQGKVHCDFVYYPSGHDLIPGYIFTPPQMPAGRKYPAMIMLHGGFHERFNVEWFPLIENLIARGYVVIFPEYHASRGYGPEIFAEEYGRSDTADVLAAGHYIGTKPFVDPNKVGIIGESRGGMVTLLAIEHEPKLFKVAVDVVGLADFVAYMSYKPQYRRDEVAKERAKASTESCRMRICRPIWTSHRSILSTRSKRRCWFWRPPAMKSRRCSFIPDGFWTHSKRGARFSTLTFTTMPLVAMSSCMATRPKNGMPMTASTPG